MKTFILFNRVFILSIIINNCQAQWTQKADFGGTARRGAVGFTIGTKIYIGTGSDENGLTNDFWEYDPDSNVWTQKANFPGTARWDAVGFSIGEKGYIGTGYTGSSFKKDFWEYDPSNNTWTQKANFGGPVRRSAIGFSIGTKGYIGTGYGTPSGTYYKDFWEYDQENDLWIQKMDFGGTARDGAIGFSIGTKGYIGTGQDLNDNYYKDFWEYDPINNAWAQKTDFGGTARTGAIGFSIGTKGYIGTGQNGVFPYTKHHDFWEYNPISATWNQKSDFGGVVRWESVGFSINAKGYIGTGQSSIYTMDFWEYLPDTDVLVADTTVPYKIKIYPNPTNDIIVIEAPIKTNIQIINSQGNIIESLILSSSKKMLDLSKFSCGVYIFKIKTDKNIVTKKIIKQ
jgi:N-acetylneuraminic acid mutarotase